MLKFLRRLFRPRWIVVATIWPYPEGYGVYCPRKHTLLDAGISKEGAELIVKEMNEQ